MQFKKIPIRKKIHILICSMAVLALPTVLLLVVAKFCTFPAAEPVQLAEEIQPSNLTVSGTETVCVTEIPTEAESSVEASTEVSTEEPTEPPESVLLDVPYYSQQGLLPTGCELVSAKMLIEYYCETVDINDIVEHTLCQYPETRNGRTYAPHPEAAFIGSPWDSSSFGCYAPVIVNMMNELLPEGLKAVDTSGTELEELALTYLPQGQPVLVWATINMLENYPNVGWYLLDEDGNETDEWYDWQANEHCLVLVGYDSSSYYFNDPYGSHGLVSYSKELVEKRFDSIGKYSVVVQNVSE
jgi:uncharacterized protein YvpB